MQTQHFERHPILYATMLRSFYKLQHYFGTIGMCISYIDNPFLHGPNGKQAHFNMQC